VTLVLLPLKYEIDDSVTVTVVLLEEVGRCIRLWAGHSLQVRPKPTSKIQVYGISAHSVHFCISCCLVSSCLTNTRGIYFIIIRCLVFLAAMLGCMRLPYFPSSNTIVNSTPRTSNTNVTQSYEMIV